MNRKIVILILNLVISICGYSQITISGNIKDQKGIPIPYATIEFKNDGKSFGKIADSIGYYTVDLPDTGSYLVKVASLNYKDSSYHYHVFQNESTMDFQLVYDNTSELGGIVVSTTKKKPLIERKIDRTVMNIEDNPLSGGKSSLEIMNFAPGVLVNYDGSISINGNIGTRIMINGKLLHLSGEALQNYLTSLRAEDIASVEIISHPPAQYSAEGTGGLINIILKKNSKSGLNGSINTGYKQGRYGTTNEGFSLNYRKDKLSLFGNYSYSQSKDFEISTTNRSSNDASIQTDIHRVNHNISNTLRLGAAYDISDKQYFGLEYNGSWLRHHHTYDAITQIIYPEQTENSYLNGISPLNMVINYHNGSFNYHLNTDNKGSSFEILSDYTNNDYQFRTNNNSKFYDYQHNYVSDTTFGTNTPSPSHIFTTDMHYQDNFAKNSSLMLGGKLTLVNIDNSSQNYIVQDDVKSDNSALDFKYKYKEKTYAGYVNYNTNFWNTEAQFGLRGEYTHVDGTLTQVNNNQYNPYHYFNLFPTVFLKKSIGQTKDYALSFTYGRRIQRPSFSDLNPYRFYVDFYTIAEGNPYLRPSIINSLELEYTFKSKYSASIFFNKQDKMIGEYWTTDASTLNSIDSRQNFGNRYNYGGELAIPIKITKWWNMDNDFTINHIEVRMQAIDVKATPVTIKSMNSLKIDKTTNFTLQFIYVSKNQFGNAITNGYSTFNMGIQKKILKNKLIINLNGEDVFNMIRMKTISYTPTSNIYFSSKRQWQTISLSLIYNFNLGKNNNVRKIKSSSSDEKARM